MIQTYAGILVAVLGVGVVGAAEAPVFKGSAHLVMTWVAPYSIPKSRARLNESFNGAGMKDGLTHLALQFWVPGKDGGLDRAGKYGEITDATIAGFVQWGHTNGVRVMLCVYNGVSGWDWPQARTAFAEHPEPFAAALVAEASRLDLDGVDIDLEGNGKFDADKGAFLKFMRELSDKLHAQKKQLTVDTFAYIWNAPNQTWWPELFPLVDGINSMGYEELGAKSDKWRGYAAQKAAAGTNAAKLMIGLPGSKSVWQGGKAPEHLEWVAKDGGVGISIWDAELKASAWRERAVWEQVGRIRAGKILTTDGHE